MAEFYPGPGLRASEKLRINHLWLEHYVDADAQKQNRAADPNPVNRVWFDDVVVARRHIGPVVPAPAPTPPPGKPGR